MKVFYHNDIDGRAAASLVTQLTGDKNPNNYIEFDYTQSLPVDKVSDNERVWIVDISISTEENVSAIKELLKRGCDVIWIDHHISSLETIEKYPELKYINGIRDINRCGAYLTYKYCYGYKYSDNEPRVPEYLQLIDDFDRHGSYDYVYGDRTNYFRLALFGTPHGPLDDIWNMLKYNTNTTLHMLLKHGEIIAKYKRLSDKDYCIKYGYESMFEGMKCFVVNNKTDSGVFGDLMNRYPILSVWVYNGSKYVYTIYTKHKEIDCSKIAAKYGGGGHPGAAGFSSDKLLLIGQNN